MSTRERYKAELEALLDGGHTVPDVLNMLAEVCSEKADWVRSPESIGTPDMRLGKAWDRTSKALDKLAGQMSGWTP